MCTAEVTSPTVASWWGLGAWFGTFIHSFKNIFVQNRSVQIKTVPSSDTFIQKRFHPNTFHPKKRFHPNSPPSPRTPKQPYTVKRCVTNFGQAVLRTLAKPSLANTNFGQTKFGQHQLWPKPQPTLAKPSFGQSKFGHTKFGQGFFQVGDTTAQQQKHNNTQHTTSYGRAPKRRGSNHNQPKPQVTLRQSLLAICLTVLQPRRHVVGDVLRHHWVKSEGFLI